MLQGMSWVEWTLRTSFQNCSFGGWEGYIHSWRWSIYRIKFYVRASVRQMWKINSKKLHLPKAEALRRLKRWCCRSTTNSLAVFALFVEQANTWRCYRVANISLFLHSKLFAVHSLYNSNGRNSIQLINFVHFNSKNFEIKKLFFWEFWVFFRFQL